MSEELDPADLAARQRAAADRLGRRLGMFVVGVMAVLFAVKVWLMASGG